MVLQAGTKKRDGTVVTAGGRVLDVIGRGVNIECAIGKAYGRVERIHFQGMQYRRDIALRGLRWELGQM